MYNTDIKERFIADFTTNIQTRKAALTLFNAVEKYENEWNADICTRTSKELEPVINNLVGLREKSSRHRLSILRAYAKWCIQHNIPGALEDLENVKDVGLDNVRNKMVASPRHLQARMDELFKTTEDDETVDVVFRCYFWMAFGGLPLDDYAEDIEEKDVDFSNMVFWHDGVSYPIYREGVPAFKKCITLEKFHTIFNGGERESYRKRAEGTTLLRRGVRNTGNIKSFRSALSRRMAESDAGNLSYYRSWLSGMFYRMHEDELSGITPNFMDSALEFMERRGEEYKVASGRNKIGAVQRKIARDYNMDYVRWKEAFMV